jgi:intracellular multiplication protein IcmE
MATKKDNIKALFKNTRTRIIIVFTGGILFSIIAFGAYKIWSLTHPQDLTSSGSIKSAPGNIRSIPGALDPTNQYAALQEQQNKEQAKVASQTGASAIPTIVRTYAFGEGVELITPKEGQAGVGFSALALSADGGDQQGLWIQSLKDGQCSKTAYDQVVAQGATLTSLHAGCSCAQLRDYGHNLAELNSICSCSELKVAGFSAKDLKGIHFTVEQLKRCGYSACEVRGAGFSAQQMKTAGFSDGELQGAGFSPQAIEHAGGGTVSASSDDAIRKAGCNADNLAKLRAQGVTAAQIVRVSGCSLAQLKAAGYTAAELKAAGFSAAELKAAGFSAAELKAAGFSAAELKAAGFSAAELKAAGFSAAELKAAGFSATELKAAGIETDAENDSAFPAITIPGTTPGNLSSKTAKAANAKLALAKQTQNLKKMMTSQQRQLTDQRYLAEVKQRSGMMMGAAKQALQEWKKPTKQVFINSSVKEEGKEGLPKNSSEPSTSSSSITAAAPTSSFAKIKAGDILFAVIDTAVNTDEPGPILATIVSGKLKGSKLIGSFVLPADADKMVINFKTISIPDVDHTETINAYAIDPDTARTALSSETNHHYLARYGALFASSFLEGFSSAIQSSNTTVEVGGTGGVTNTTVSTLNRSALDNALIGLGQVGKDWSKSAQKEMNRPTTVQVYSGTGIGVLFTQDATI